MIITATKNDKELTENILLNTQNVINLTGRTQLSDLVYIFRNADIVISPDSGSAHVAWASGAKSVLTLFFATCAERTAPFGEYYKSLSANINCAPCMKKKCKYKTNECIQKINSQSVIDNIYNLLKI